MAFSERRRVLLWVALVLMSVVVSAAGGGKPTEEDVHAQVRIRLGAGCLALISRRLEFRLPGWVSQAETTQGRDDKRAATCVDSCGARRCTPRR